MIKIGNQTILTEEPLANWSKGSSQSLRKVIINLVQISMHQSHKRVSQEEVAQRPSWSSQSCTTRVSPLRIPNSSKQRRGEISKRNRILTLGFRCRNRHSILITVHHNLWASKMFWNRGCSSTRDLRITRRRLRLSTTWLEHKNTRTQKSRRSRLLLLMWAARWRRITRSNTTKTKVLHRKLKIKSKQAGANGCRTMKRSSLL